jgi:hypothetical protein
MDLLNALINKRSYNGDWIPNPIPERLGFIAQYREILDRANDKTDPMAFRNDPWARELRQALLTDGHFFSEPGHAAPPVPSKLAAQGAFEVSRRHRVAIWHAGFVDAASRLDGINPWLAGADDGVLAPPV